MSNDLNAVTAQTLDRAALLALATPGTPVTLISCELDNVNAADMILLSLIHI